MTSLCFYGMMILNYLSWLGLMEIPENVRQYWAAQWWIFVHFGLPALCVVLVLEFGYVLWERYGKGRE